MTIKEIFSDSIRYPFLDLSKFVIVGIFALLAGISGILSNYTVDGSIMAASGVISFIAALIVAGYGVSVIRTATERSAEVPSLSLLDNFIDGIKLIIVNVVYFIVPAAVVIILAVLSGMGLIVHENLFLGLEITVILIGIVLFLLFAIMGEIAIAKFAKTGEYKDAFALREVFGDLKRIGILRIVAFIIIQFLIVLAVAAVLAVIGFVPYVGLVISSFVGGAFLTLFTYRALGLLYAGDE